MSHCIIILQQQWHDAQRQEELPQLHLWEKDGKIKFPCKTLILKKHDLELRLKLEID